MTPTRLNQSNKTVDYQLSMTEDQLKASVMELCDRLKLRYVHFKPAQLPGGRWVTPFEGHAGWPDMVILGPCDILVRELKTIRNKPTKDQTLWLDGFRKVAVDADIWTPEDWQSGRIKRELFKAAGR